VDNQTIKDFEKNLEGNLYKIWNRMSSGSYFPPAVRLVEIAKSDGKMRQLGIPTVADRIAQMVAKLYFEPRVEPYFHEDSYGYRPKRSAHDALAKARKRCWDYDWVIDLDIKGFFDNLDHELVMRAVKRHTDCAWLHLYLKRWLTAPVQLADGTLVERTRGTPQGGVISPLLANLFLHYALDEWMKKEHPNNPFERYADDCVIHCTSLKEAINLKQLLEQRMLECQLECHPEKTKIVYCQDANRKENYPQTEFDFLGYTFRQRRSENKRGEIFWNFLPAISKKAVKAISTQMKSWRLPLRSESTLEQKRLTR
jgi:RNA-directed DNA polymerase